MIVIATTGAIFGEFREVKPLPEGKHLFLNPIEEAENMVGKDRVIAVRIDDESAPPPSA